MTTLAEVNASLGVTNIALSDVVKQQKETKRPEIIKDGSNIIKLDFNATT